MRLAGFALCGDILQSAQLHCVRVQEPVCNDFAFVRWLPLAVIGGHYACGEGKRCVSLICCSMDRRPRKPFGKPSAVNQDQPSRAEGTTEGKSQAGASTGGFGTGFAKRFSPKSSGGSRFDAPVVGPRPKGAGREDPIQRPPAPREADDEAEDRTGESGEKPSFVAQRPMFKHGKRKGKMYGGSDTVPRPADADDDPHAPKFRRKIIKDPNLRIVHEDADLIVVDKPTNTPTAGITGTDAKTLLQTLKEHLKENKPRIPRRMLKEQQFLAEERGTPLPDRTPPIGVIHRLDKEASGLVVFSKSERAFHWLKDDFKTRRAKRTYIAVVEGNFGEVGKTGMITSNLVEDQAGTVHSVSEADAQKAMEKATQPGRGQDQSQNFPNTQNRYTTNRSSDSRYGDGRSSYNSPGGQRGNNDGRSRDLRHDRPSYNAGTPGGTFSSTMSGDGEDDAGKAATTVYTVLHFGEGRTVLELSLHTGRKHQIRVHLSEAGHPIVGDERYGARTDPIKRLALHAKQLVFSHPASGQLCTFTAPVPASFYKLVGLDAPQNDPNYDPRQDRPNIRPGRPAAATAWENVATWYDQMIDEQRNDHYANVIIPGTLRLLEPFRDERILDVACGQGVISRELAELGCTVVGVDASPSLISAAKTRARHLGDLCKFVVGDATKLAELKLPPASFDKAACVMALANIDPLEPVISALATLIKPDGKFVMIITHPAFRAHGQSSWQWDNQTGQQFRRIDGYLSNGSKPIQMHPGDRPEVTTTSFHRPLQTYVRLLTEAGFAITGMQEWPALRVSQPGPRADAENRARREIPLFLAVKATRIRSQ